MDNSEVKEIKSATTAETTNETNASTTEKNEVASVPAVVEKKNEDEIQLENLDMDFAYDLMSVPTVSSEEYRMVSYIILWARRNNVNYEFDSYGNVYLTKGELEEGEFYPCVTSHLDTVQQKQKAYAQAGCALDLKIRKTTTKKHELYVDGMGIGADCKTGILISLSLFKHFDKIKGAFFLEEEIGMKGSDRMNVEWFNNVGYVIGWDSPELNRAAWSCSGTKLMSKDFFVNNIQEICKKHGLTKFHAEPFTDVKNIREKTDIVCMNFGNGGYLAHSSTEYMVLEDTDHALTMGIDLIKGLGNKKYSLEHKEKSYAWVKQADGTYKKPEEDKDEDFFRKLDGYTYGGGNYGGSCYRGGCGGYYDEDDWDDYYGNYRSGSYSGGTGTSGSTSGSTTSHTTSSSTTPNKNEETVNIETVKYISERYEQRIGDIQNVIAERCKELGIDFAKFSDVFEEKIKF